MTSYCEVFFDQALDLISPSSKNNIEGHICLKTPFRVVLFNLRTRILKENRIRIIRFGCMSVSLRTFLILSSKILSFSLLTYFSGSLINIPAIDDEAKTLKALDTKSILCVSASEERRKVQRFQMISEKIKASLPNEVVKYSTPHLQGLYVAPEEIVAIKDIDYLPFVFFAELVTAINKL